MNDDVAIWEADSLADHMALLQRQVTRSLKDPETTRLARKIVGFRPDGEEIIRGERVPVVQAWGRTHVLIPVDCPMRDDACEILAIWNFAVANVRYVLDPDGYDLFSTVKYTLDANAGDCDDFTILFGALLRAVGFQNVFARVVSVSGEYWEHVYTMVGMPKSGHTKRLIALDPTVPGATPGWEFEGVKTKEDFRL